MKTFNVIEAIEINKEFCVCLAGETTPVRVFQIGELENILKQDLISSNVVLKKWKIYHPLIQFVCEWSQFSDGVNFPLIIERGVEKQVDKICESNLKTRVTIEVLE